MEVKGSYTLEASLLMPLIIGTIVILLFISFYLHDNAVIKEGAIILANKYTNEKNLSNSEIKQKLEQDCEQVILNKVLVTRSITTNIKVEKKKITVSCSGVFYFPSIFISQTIFNSNSLNIATTKSMNRVNPVTFIRYCKIVEGFIN
ncbi:hypothetical protein [Candidatus Galacturonibacter soehngenii]|uniref:Pilus assembly protein n=1 Tax=Candidatus Galacturonatibacter soehngenii TaxID=2307010 RepID=A0A7V7QM03_9FIRM|nr:hypothetical protein [Candidatus Galacturonibacter soehngenii]KAB1438631.1 hypothetical protein F7O84_13970 [Candidatus Galacturonibacter soehngenii]